jgi:peptidoglycan-N-acetylglucosamine deacetylase
MRSHPRSRAQTRPLRSTLTTAAGTLAALVGLTACAGGTTTATPSGTTAGPGTTTAATTTTSAGEASLSVQPFSPDSADPNPHGSQSPAPVSSPSETPSSVPSISPAGPTSPSQRSSRCHPTVTPWGSGPALSDRTVALTFDDGPGRDTAAVLDVLARAKVHATFFDIGAHAARQPDLVRREVAEGHQVGGHSWDHRYPWVVPGGWTYAFVDGQMRDTVGFLRKLTGQSVCFYRPPGGIMTNMRAAADAEGMQLTLWTVDPKDWAHPQEGYAYSADARGIVVRATQPGTSHNPIVLMHDGMGPRGATVAALPHVIEWYRSHGYRFVRLDGHS